MSGAAPAPAPTVAVDAHVHAHPCFRLGAFLDAAHGGLRRARPGAEPTGILLMAGVGESEGLAPFRAPEAGGSAGEWRIEETGEDLSLRAVRGTGELLFLVEGRQIATRERLEVLALAGRVDAPDGLPFRETLERVVASEALPVVPWGFGKWLGRRGEAVRAAVEDGVPGRLFLGDNGGRPRWTPEPGLFREAARRGIWTLPGSDPLPFRAEAGRAGSRGIVLTGRVDPRRPARSVRDLLRGLERQPETFGRGLGPVRFAVTQLRMHARQRLRRPAPPPGGGRARTGASANTEHGRSAP